MIFVSTAHSVLRLITALLLLKNAVAIRARQIERRSLYFGNDGSSLITRPTFSLRQPGIQYASQAPTSVSPLSLTPADAATATTFTPHQFYHDYNLQPQLSTASLPISAPVRTLGAGALIPIQYGAPFYGSASLQPSQVFSGNAIDDTEDDAEPYYYHGDRILKQYLVSEKSKHDLLLDNHLGNPFRPPPILRYETRRLPFGGIVDVPVFDTSLEPRLHPFKPSTLRKNHGPIALGSGSLGLISLPNGNVYLGSGSLGYVSEKQHVDTLVKPTDRPFLIPSPLHFGSNDN